tara:strand:- start:386 stop:1303 length:918 start_codon:yes stop_codon:yes gene_type:complete
MNIVFLSESNIRGKVERTFENSRTEFGWSIALDAEWLPITENTTKKYDLGIVIIPKNNPNVDLDRIRNFCDKVAVMQEGPHWYFQDYEIDKQFNYYNTLMSADWVYCHNYSDTKYYKGLGCKDVRIMRSLMIPDGIQPRSDWGDVTMIGGNFVSWYGGFDSYIVAREIGDPISCPSMGRKQQQEDLIDDINYLPYMSWREWIHTLGQFNIGIHLMRTHAAGTFAMNCAFHGIPCIGYYGLDTQEILHPLLTVELGDLKRAVKLAKKLKKDKDFYNDCSSVARDRYLNQYSEEVWLKKWRDENETN